MRKVKAEPDHHHPWLGDECMEDGTYFRSAMLATKERSREARSAMHTFSYQGVGLPGHILKPCVKLIFYVMPAACMPSIGWILISRHWVNPLSQGFSDLLFLFLLFCLSPCQMRARNSLIPLLYRPMSRRRWPAQVLPTIQSWASLKALRVL